MFQCCTELFQRFTEFAFTANARIRPLRGAEREN